MMGLMLLNSADAWGQSSVPNLFTAKLPTPLALDADETIELQWVQGEKEFVGEAVARAAKFFLGGDFLTTQYKSFEVTPIVGSDLYGITVSYKW